MSVRERILTLRLMEKVKKNPAYAERLGIAVTNGMAEARVQTASDPAENKS